MNPRHLLTMACLVGLGLQGCGTTYPQLLGERYFVTSLNTFPVLIISVDGKGTLISPVQVDPGLRKIVVQGTPGGSGVTVLENFMLDVKPCTRYYIVAVKASPLDSNFTPRIDYEEPLAGCRRSAT